MNTIDSLEMMSSLHEKDTKKELKKKSLLGLDRARPRGLKRRPIKRGLFRILEVVSEISHDRNAIGSNSHTRVVVFAPHIAWGRPGRGDCRPGPARRRQSKCPRAATSRRNIAPQGPGRGPEPPVPRRCHGHVYTYDHIGRYHMRRICMPANCKLIIIIKLMA